jgi:oligopeptide/dipeptide ABC transporter ATP-binding protein
MSQPLLVVRNLHVAYPGRRGPVQVVCGVSFELARGTALGIVGESGSGKSTLALALLRLPGVPGRVTGGQAFFNERDLMTMPEAELRQWRGSKLAMILQDPLNSLNPLYTNGDQIAEAPIVHERLSLKAAMARAVELLGSVRIADPELRVNEYPHQISGGMRQRVAGAIALSCKPELLIADEPTTALDPTVQAQYLDLLKALQAEHGFGLILISHDLNVIRRTCGNLAVMYAGRIVEQGATAQVLAAPAHPYTRALLGALPQPGRRAGNLAMIDGQPPDPADLPGGCPFHPRCTRASDRCRLAEPAPERVASGSVVACFHPWPETNVQ